MFRNLISTYNAQVLYAFILCGKMKKGESVLIHAGTGGVGQAAINVCLFYGCEIFTTVGTPEKREFIRKTFPSVGCIHDTFSMAP